VVVVLPTPPFWLAMQKILAMGVGSSARWRGGAVGVPIIERLQRPAAASVPCGDAR
jgi:hypothetical protein